MVLSSPSTSLEGQGHESVGELEGASPPSRQLRESPPHPGGVSLSQTFAQRQLRVLPLMNPLCSQVSWGQAVPETSLGFLGGS